MNKKRVIDAVIVFILAVAILIFLSPVAVQKTGIIGVAIPEILMVMIAIAFVLIRKDSIRDRLSLGFPSIKSFFGAVLLVFGTNAWQNAVTMFQTALTGGSSETDLTFFEAYYDKVTPFMMLLAVALVPAICEEIFFRGFLLNCFKTKKSGIAAIIITALLFAGIHLDIYKFLPLLIMALTYGYIAYKTKSVLLPAIFHFLNNSLAVISFYTMKNSPTEEIEVLLSEKTYLGYGIASIGFGLLLVYFGSRMLSGKPRQKRSTLKALIISGAIFTVGIAILLMNMVYVPYSGSYQNTITEDTEYTESFTLDTEAYAMVDASIKSNRRIDCNIVIKDSVGTTVYDHSNETSNILSLQPGDYTVIYSFNVDENSGLVYNVNATLKIRCLSFEENTEGTVADDTAEPKTAEPDTDETSEADLSAI